MASSTSDSDSGIAPGTTAVPSTLLVTRAVEDFARHAARYVERHAHEAVRVEGSDFPLFLPLDIGGALIPASLPANARAPFTDDDLRSLTELCRAASKPFGALSVRFDKGLFTRGLRIFYVNSFHADSTLRARAPDEDYERAPAGTLRGPFLATCARTGAVLVGDFVELSDGSVLAPSALTEADAGHVARRSTLRDDALGRMGSAFDWLPFCVESGIPKVFWLVNVNADSPQFRSIALLGMDHDDGKTSLLTSVWRDVGALLAEMREYVHACSDAVSTAAAAGGGGSALLTWGEWCFYSRAHSLFYPSISTHLISVDCNTEPMDWRASSPRVASLPPNVDPFHRELIKSSSTVNRRMLEYEASIADTQARLAASSDAGELEDDDDMVRGGAAAGAPLARAPKDVVNSWVEGGAIDAAVRHDGITQEQQPIKYDVRNIEESDEERSVFYRDVLTTLPRMVAAFDALASTHPDWSDVQVRERVMDMNSDFARFTNGRFNLVQHLLKRERDAHLLEMTMSVAEACDGLQRAFERDSRYLDRSDPEERDEYDALRAKFEQEVDREIQHGWLRHGFDDAAWLNQEVVRDMEREA